MAMTTPSLPMRGCRFMGGACLEEKCSAWEIKRRVYSLERGLDAEPVFNDEWGCRFDVPVVESKEIGRQYR